MTTEKHSSEDSSGFSSDYNSDYPLTRNSSTSSDSKRSESSHRNKKCIIKIVLPSQNDGLISHGENNLDRSFIDTTPEPPPSTPVSELFDDVTCRDAEAEHTTCYKGEKTTVERKEKTVRRLALTSDGIAMTGEGVRKTSVESHKKGQVKQRIIDRDSPRNIMDRIEAIRKHLRKGPNVVPKTTNKAKQSNVSGSFVDIGGWQDEMKKASIHEVMLQKRKPQPKALENRTPTSIVGGSHFKFEHHEELQRYIRDYRYSHTAGGVGMKHLWDGSIQNIHRLTSSQVPQRSLGVPEYRAKTSDPTARTFLPKTHLLSTDIRGGCSLCEQERFSLRNSFPKRVYLSWKQYMTLCKANSLLMSQTNSSYPSEYPVTPHPTPRAVTSYSPTRPMLLLNQHETNFDLESNLQNIHSPKTLSERNRKLNHDQNNPLIDKTILVYRLSGKRRNSINGGNMC